MRRAHKIRAAGLRAREGKGAAGSYRGIGIYFDIKGKMKNIHQRLFQN
jgi:hypothetical protein